MYKMIPELQTLLEKPQIADEPFFSGVKKNEQEG
jgi:hypothetical protein